MRRLLIFDHLSSALFSLRANRMRSLLTTLGITIGIASVTTILSLAAGVTGSITRQIDDIGGTVAVIRPGATTNSTERIFRPISPQQYSTSTLDENDVKSIEALDKNVQAAPIMTIDGTLKAKNGNISNGMVVATTPTFAKTTSLTMQDGSFLDESSPPQSAIVGWQMAINLFGTNDPIGQNFQLRGRTFTVVGILKKINNPLNHNNIDFDQVIIIPFESGKKFHNGRSQIQQINLVAKDQSTLQAVIPKIEQALDTNHGERDFSVISGDAIAEPTNSMFTVLARIMTAIAIISLIVGGIGIMNIMLVSVTERTREIGIRKAVGASNTNIVTQFVVESLLIGLTGGVIGVLCGIALAFIFGLSFSFMPVITPMTILIAGGLSLVVGVIFGIYPALRAASKDPIESLRLYR
jgi:putative ABC transport system permease protein